LSLTYWVRVWTPHVRENVKVLIKLLNLPFIFTLTFGINSDLTKKTHPCPTSSLQLFTGTTISKEATFMGLLYSIVSVKYAYQRSIKQGYTLCFLYLSLTAYKELSFLFSCKS
jgi:hypothetical protein